MYRSMLRGQEFEQVFPYFCAVRCSGGGVWRFFVWLLGSCVRGGIKGGDGRF